MNGEQPKQALVGLAVAVALAMATMGGCGSSGGVSTTGAGPSDLVFAPTSTPYGRSYGQWSAAWWQWVLRIPKADNPMLDATGAKQSIGQSGQAWFLAGTQGNTAERTCTVPAGKAVLFPIINTVGVVTEPGETVASLAAAAKENQDHVTELEARLDGIDLADLRSHRFQSPTFSVTFDTQDPLWSGLAGPYEAVSDGYWVMLQPLSVGAHTLFFRGKLVTPASTTSGEQVFQTQVTYHLTVQ